MRVIGIALEEIVLVTGASRGIGRRIASGLAEKGYLVVAVARNQEELFSLSQESKGKVVVFCGDVSDPDFVIRLQKQVLTAHGVVQVLVNAAGIYGPLSLVHETDPSEWVRTIMVDLVAPYYLMRAFLPDMLGLKWGRIVNIGSAASLHSPGALNSAYGTAKVSLNQLTRHVAAEVAGSGVTVNVIHPGDVKTEMWADIRHKTGRLGEVGRAYQDWVDWVEKTGGDDPQKSIDLVLKLIGPDSASVNGRFCWISEPLQAPIPSWLEPGDTRPWGDAKNI